MDLNDIPQFAETTTIEVRHPVSDEVITTEKGKPWTVEVYGSDSQHFKNYQHQETNRRLSRMARKGKVVPQTAEQMEAQALEIIVHCVKGWTITMDGKSAATDKDTVRDVLRQHVWLKEQIETAIYDRSAYLGN